MAAPGMDACNPAPLLGRLLHEFLRQFFMPERAAEPSRRQSELHRCAFDLLTLENSTRY
jgi:hypothetical protein